MRVKVLFLIVGLLAATTGIARAAVFYPSHFTLSNGLQVIVVPNRLAPVVSQMVWYKVGSADEAKGKTGLAHYLEHLMFRGTEAVAPGEFSRIIAGQGGENNAFTSYDYTAYHEEVEASRLPMIMQMEADRMQHLRIVKETAEPELHVILDERQQRTDNSPQGRFAEKMQAAFLPNYPYGRPVIGAKKDIEKLSVADARAFYETYYAPNNAVVVISGDVKVEDVMSLAAATFGRVPKRDVAPSKAFSPAPLPRKADVTMKDPRIEQPTVQARYVVPSYVTGSDKAYAYEVLSEVLDAGKIGILYKKLVTEGGLASAVDVSYDPDARGETDFTITAAVRGGQDYLKLQQALRAALAEQAEKGIDSKLVQEAKQRLQRAAIFAREGLMMPGYAFGMAMTTGHSSPDVEEWPERIEAVTTEQVNAALRDLVESKRTITGALLPQAKPVKKAVAAKPTKPAPKAKAAP